MIPGEAFRVGEWLVQRQLNQIQRQSEVRHLEPKVMEVLCYFARHPNKVLSRERLLQAVWPDTFVTDDALKYSIGELRKALGDDAKDPTFLETIPRRGYRLIAPVVQETELAQSRYQILEPIGRGAMGEVVLAEDRLLRRNVALKFLLPGLEADEMARKRFLREARLAAALDHPYVCGIHDMGELDGRTFIAMEYVDGQTLRTRLDERRLPVLETLCIALEVAEALEKAHAVRIIHRDLKPSNIMLTAEGHAKVMDFGLAKPLVPDAKRGQDLSATWSKEGRVGSPAYMSPEQVRADPLDHRSDIFSLGIVLYEMLTGVHPFRDAGPEETTAAILKDEPVSLSDRLGAVPELLQHTVSKMLAKNPDNRYQSVHEVRTNLRELSIEVSRPPEGVTSLQRRPSWIPVSLGLIGLILATLFVYWGWNVRRQPSPAVEQDRKSIAVLPFKNLSPNPDDEYFSDGITEDITLALAKISDLKVVGRTSAFLYKGSEKRLREIAAELGVATLLDGSVRKDDGRVRVAAQLIDGTTEEHLWAEDYDRELDDIFAIQSDVAQQITAALEAELSSAEKKRIEKRPTGNLTAYDYYLKGLEYWRRFTPQGNEDAIALFQRALEEDPDFAAARSFLGAAYMIQHRYFGASPDWVDRGIQEAELALLADPDCSEALVNLSYGYLNKGWIRKGLETAERAIELNPSDHVAFLLRGVGYWLAGELDQAFSAIREALALSPRDHLYHWSLGNIYFFLGEYEKAEQCFQQALDLQPDYPLAQASLSWSKLHRGRIAEAKEIGQRLLSLAPAYPLSWFTAGYIADFEADYPTAREYFQKAFELAPAGEWGPPVGPYSTQLAITLWETGDRVRAEELFEQSFQMDQARLAAGDERPAPCVDIAQIHAIRGEKEAAYRWLEEAIDKGLIPCALDYRMWSNLENDERFQQMLADLKAKVDEMRRRVDEREKEWEP